MRVNVNNAVILLFAVFSPCLIIPAKISKTQSGGHTGDVTNVSQHFISSR